MEKVAGLRPGPLTYSRKAREAGASASKTDGANTDAGRIGTGVPTMTHHHRSDFLHSEHCDSVGSGSGRCMASEIFSAWTLKGS